MARYFADSDCFERLAAVMIAVGVDEVALPVELAAVLVQLRLELLVLSVVQCSQRDLVSLVFPLPS